MISPDHTHEWVTQDKAIRLHNYRVDKGIIEAIDMTAVDTLRQRICKCGTVETYDLKRKKLI